MCSDVDNSDGIGYILYRQIERIERTIGIVHQPFRQPHPLRNLDPRDHPLQSQFILRLIHLGILLLQLNHE